MKSLNIITVTLLLFATAVSNAYAQTLDFLPRPEPTTVINLWEGAKPPTDNGLRGNETYGDLWVSNISNPTLTIYAPSKCNGRAIIVTPGGGYGVVYTGAEGPNLAKWFVDRGFTFAVLKYRLPNGHPTVPLEDFQRAITIMRDRSDEWGDYTSVGVMGGSAGGHCASMVSTHYNSDVTRPDFQILMYPVISFQDGLAHVGSMNNLLGQNASKQLRDFYSSELQVTAETPPAFIIHAADDSTVPMANSIVYAQALIRKGVPVNLFIWPTGEHGCHTDSTWDFTSQYWMELEKFLNDIQAPETAKGKKVVYTFDEFENEYRILSEKKDGVVETDGKLTADGNAEHIVMFESETPMDEFLVSCDIKSLDATYDAGILMLANGETVADLKNSAFCVQIIGTRVRLQQFDPDTGKWKVLKGATCKIGDDGVNLKVIYKNNCISVYIDNNATPSIIYELGDDAVGLSGNVGLYANKKATEFDNFTIKSEQYKKKEITGIKGASLMNDEEGIMNNSSFTNRYSLGQGPHTVYDLQGRAYTHPLPKEGVSRSGSELAAPHSTLKPGIYIVNSKKIVIL